MKYIVPISLFSLILLLSVQCKSSKELYEQGNYKSAITRSLKSLKKDNGNQEKKVLNRSLRAYTREQESEIKVFARTNPSQIKELQYNLKTYDELAKIFDDSRAYQDDRTKELAKDVQYKYNYFRDNTYQYYMDFAKVNKLKFDASDAKSDARVAYEYYQQAYDTKSSSEFPLSTMDDMLYHATERINITFDVFESELKDEFRNNLQKTEGFNQFFLEQNRKDLDCHIDIDCMFYDVDDRETSSTQTYEEKVQDGFTVTKDANGKEAKVPKYVVVKAFVTEKKIIREASWKVNFNVRNISGQCSLSNESYSPEVEYTANQTSFRGDRRALPSGYVDSRNSNNLPGEEKIKADLAELILTYFERKY